MSDIRGQVRSKILSRQQDLPVLGSGLQKSWSRNLENRIFCFIGLLRPEAPSKG